MKYHIPENESENYTNKLGIIDPEEINRLETAGFALAEEIAYSELNKDTRFSLAYIYQLHDLALGSLYDFAGKLRSVKITKGGFTFPFPQYLDQTMLSFEKEHLRTLPEIYSSDSELIKDIARIHTEFLFIHPFREGNGRTARLLANLMSLKATDKPLDFSALITEKGYHPDYIKAIQKADDALMTTLIGACFDPPQVSL